MFNIDWTGSWKLEARSLVTVEAMGGSAKQPIERYETNKIRSPLFLLERREFDQNFVEGLGPLFVKLCGIQLQEVDRPFQNQQACREILDLLMAGCGS